MTIIGGVGAPTQPRKEIPVERKWNWKHIAIAAIAVASILGLIAAISLFNTNPATTTTSSGWQPPPEPANPGGWIPPDEPNELATTPTPAEIPSPDEITPADTLIDISNPPEFLAIPSYDLVITDIKIDKKTSKIKGNFVNINPEENFELRPIRIFFFSTTNKYSGQIGREQWYCRYNDRQKEFTYKYGMVHAHCQWPEDFCFMVIGTEDRKKVWEDYWAEKLGKKQQQSQKVGSTKYETIIPTLKPGEKYSFEINNEIPTDTKYIQIK